MVLTGIHGYLGIHVVERKVIFVDLALGWLLGILTSFAGIAFSYFLDLPTGATIVCAFGGMLALAAAIKKLASIRR